jgi:hypothetical protein
VQFLRPARQALGRRHIALADGEDVRRDQLREGQIGGREALGPTKKHHGLARGHAAPRLRAVPVPTTYGCGRQRAADVVRERVARALLQQGAGRRRPASPAVSAAAAAAGGKPSASAARGPPGGGGEHHQGHGGLEPREQRGLRGDERGHVPLHPRERHGARARALHERLQRQARPQRGVGRQRARIVALQRRRGPERVAGAHRRAQLRAARGSG